ncbi:protein PROCA1 [Electrophorus electricus]|uniref:protein PROCA1 n=1 Tax=Electrophorus electricus TaxID=8005 RepID=UPI0015CFBD69|nr:protein PROCA1 [Electrophorus electricus]
MESAPGTSSLLRHKSKTRALEIQKKEGKVLFHMLDNTFCGKISVVGPYSFYEVSDGAENVRSVHDSAGNLVDCSVTADPIHVKSFHARFVNVVLREQRTQTALPRKPGVPHGAAGRDGRQTTEVQARVHLSRYSPGEFAETDECCRAHDYCPDVIHAFSFKYGYVNLKWHSVSHCDCDNALKQCLRKVNDTSSRVVGQAFFNVIEVPCFEFSFEEQCVERYWYGVCKRYGRVPVAVLRESIPYDFGGVELIDAFTMSPPKKKLAEVETTQASESTTPSSVSGSASTTQPLPKVVTAAEDFIEALAAVSTSQRPALDGSRDAHAADKKRKKNVGKKRKDSKKRRRKEQGKKRKQSADAAPAAQEQCRRHAAGQTSRCAHRSKRFWRRSWEFSSDQ